MKFTILASVPITIPISEDIVRPYKGPNDPPLEWYKTFCSMQYNIVEIGRYGTTYELTPVVGRPVYTFDTMGEFILTAREFTVRLFTTQFMQGVAQYRVHRSPVRQHRVYKLPPAKTWMNT